MINGMCVTWAHAHHAWGEYGSMSTDNLENHPFHWVLWQPGNLPRLPRQCPNTTRMVRTVTKLPWKNMRARVHALLAAQLPPTPNASGLMEAAPEKEEEAAEARHLLCVCVFFLR